MSGSLTILPIPPRAVLDLVREDPHAALGIRPGAVLRLHHGLGHRRGHRGTALVVVLALGNLADEAVVRRLRRGAATYISWRWTKTMRAFGPSRWSVNSLVLEQQVGDPAQQLALVLVERAPSGMYASHIGIVCCLLPDSWCLLSSRSLRDGAGASERLAELAVIGIVARAS
jgi:hypothetical protein